MAINKTFYPLSMCFVFSFAYADSPQNSVNIWFSTTIFPLVEPALITFLSLLLFHYRIKLKRKSKRICEVQQNLEQVQELFKKASECDPLTGAKTRTQFLSFLNEKQFSSTPYMLAVFNIHNLRKINKSYGLDVGDMMIKHVASQLATNLNRINFARLSGGEFAILFEEKEFPAMEKIINQLQKKLQNNPLQFDQMSLPVSISHGTSLYPTDHQDSETLLRLAISRMYRSYSGDEINEPSIPATLLSMQD